jgi:hypothetical protein
MYKTDNGHIEVLVAPKISDLVLQYTDWTIIDVGGFNDIDKFSLNLFKTPVLNHVCLMFNRGKLECLKSIPDFAKNGWTYVDSIAVVYNKSIGSSNKVALTKQAETGYLFYKGHAPDITHANWFLSNDSNTLSNYWDVDISMGEGSYTVPDRFSFQLNLLLRSITGHITSRAFNYFCETDNKDLRLIHDFCYTMQYKCYLYVATADEARKIIKFVNNLECKSLI